MDPDTTSSLIASASSGPTTLQVVLLCALPVLVCGSAFFSGSETALFGLTVSERLELRRQQTVGARAAIRLLQRPRLLLILLLPLLLLLQESEINLLLYL